LWQDAAVRPQGPALPGLGIDERKDCVRWSLERVESADLFEVADRPVVAGEQEMVAIVNAATEFRIQVGTAASAGVVAGFIKPHVSALGGKPDRGGKASQTGADDMHRT